MSDFSNKIRTNLKNGTLIINGFNALKNRILKYTLNNNLFYIFDEDRVRTKKYLSNIPLIDENHYLAGNYYLDKRVPLSKSSVVYSLGILNDIRFDRFISNQVGCSIFMYDPTPLSIEFMNKQRDKNFKFFPYGVWTEETTLKFYAPKYGGSSSILESSETIESDFFEAKCYTVSQLMARNGHNSIDLFKADIEGAALPILEQMIDQKVFPKEIVVEFERPREDKSQIDDFFFRVDEVRKKLKEEGYSEYLIPRRHAKYYSIEFLFVILTN
ncbi:FkbM family methyltransferase [bacterium]|nr:FkbM family methyltransferase [bacterium]